VDIFQYKEVASQLLLMAFLQQVVNGGGRIDREYGLGRGRVDLYVAWPISPTIWPRVVIEMQIIRGSPRYIDTLTGVVLMRPISSSSIRHPG
jgi:hypothetical protein